MSNEDEMTRYFIGIGSNIQPYENVPTILASLVDLGLDVFVGRIIETEPVGVKGGLFLNTVAGFSSVLSPQEVKEHCNSIEIRLGRKRQDPSSKYKSRPADLDILLILKADACCLDAEMIPMESYLRPVMLELIGEVGIRCSSELMKMPNGVLLHVNGQAVGLKPVCLRAKH